MKAVLWLIKNGIPFDVAFSLSPEEVFAYGVHFGIFEGNEFDVENLRWVKK